MKKSRKKDLSGKHGVRVPARSFVDGNIHFLLPAMLLGALVVRILAFSSFSHSLYGNFLLQDERVYQAWAEDILAGIPFVVHDFSPLPAYVMAAVYWLFGIDPDHVRMVNIMFDVLTCFFIYGIARDLATRTIGLIACLISSLYKPFVFLSITILKESLGLFLFSATIYLFVSLMKGSDSPPVVQGGREEAHGKGKKPWVRYSGKILFLGITAGLLINVRQNCVVLLPVFPLLLLWMMYRRVFSLQKAAWTITVYVVGLFLALSPFLIRNHLLTGEFRASPAGGFNLYLANNLDNPYPYYRPVPFASSSPVMQATQFIIEASRREGKKLSPREASSFWTWEVIRTALEHPGAMAWKFWQKTLVLFNQYEAEDNYNLGFISRFVPFFRLPFFAFWFVFPLGMACMILTIRKSEKTLALGIVSLVYALTLIAFLSNMRIRVPLLVIVIPYAVMGVDMVFKVFRKRIPLADVRPYLIVLAALTVIEFLPVTGTGDLTAHYNTHAFNLVSKGSQLEAVRYWEESSAMKRPYSASADLSLADWYYQKGDYLKVETYLEKIPDDSFVAARKYELWGDTWTNRKRVDRAVLAYERSKQINAGQINVIKKLVRLYESADPLKAEGERAYLAYITSFYSAGQGYGRSAR
jgi:4-amino-4-deoxy-L-arabinose transferase-like glycosyltransferase